MIPNSVKYVILLFFIFCLYYLVGKKYRKLVLLSSSLISLLVLTNIFTLILFAFISGFTYYFGIFIYISLTNRAKKIFLIVGIIANIAFLFLLKYILPAYMPYNNYSVIELVVYNIGVSYYILQCISYLYDIRHDIFYPEKNYFTFVLYLIFFPKFIQGPIERASSLIPQLKLDNDFNYDNFKSGLLLILIGLFQKAVIADRLGLYVDTVYSNVNSYVGPSLYFATFLFSLQLCFDFSGYTNIALGSAKLFNIHLTPNFNKPYLSTSISEFWKRWHISFSSWLQDYIFQPVQLKLKIIKGGGYKNRANVIGIFTTFVICGLWHGISFNFLTWGIIISLYMCIGIFTKQYRDKLKKLLKTENHPTFNKSLSIFFTFNLITFSWIFFRANSMNDSFYIISNILTGWNDIINITNINYLETTFFYGHGYTKLFVCFTAIIYFLIVTNTKNYFESEDITILNKIGWKRWSFYYIIAMFIMLFSYFNKNQFIYFNF